VKTSPNQTRTHHPPPFDGSARTRLTHMGMLSTGGSPIPNVISTFADIIGGLFYVDFVALYRKPGDLRAIYRRFIELLTKREYDHMFVFLCIQYDFMHKPLPEPVLWLAGQPRALAAFMPLFMDKLTSLMTMAGYIKSSGGRTTA